MIWKPSKTIVLKLCKEEKNTQFLYIIRHFTDKQSTHTHILTSHGAESKELLCVVVVGGTTPSHAITAAIGGAVGVVAATVEEREVAQATVGVSTSCYHNGWNREGDTTLDIPVDITEYP